MSSVKSFHSKRRSVIRRPATKKSRSRKGKEKNKMKRSNTAKGIKKKSTFINQRSTSRKPNTNKNLKPKSFRKSTYKLGENNSPSHKNLSKISSQDANIIIRPKAHALKISQEDRTIDLRSRSRDLKAKRRLLLSSWPLYHLRNKSILKQIQL